MVRKAGTLVMLTATAAGCAAFLANTDVSLVSLRATAASASADAIDVTFDVTNRNSTQSRLIGVLYRFLVRTEDGWVEAAEGYSVQDVALPSNQNVQVGYSFPVDLPDGLSSADAGFAPGEYRLEGELRVMGGLGQVQVPFSFEATQREQLGHEPL